MKSFKLLKKPYEFSAVYKNAKKSHLESVVIFYKPSNEKKVGFTVSKKIGKAVKRNFAKRRLKALFFEIEEHLKEGIFVFVAKKAIIEKDYGKIKKEIIKALQRLNLYKEKVDK